MLWWTFSGGQINHTLKMGIEHLTHFKAVIENYRIKIEGDVLTFQTIETLIPTLSTVEFRHAPDARNHILTNLSQFHLSKFQYTLPDTCANEMLQSFLPDVDGTIRFLKNATDPISSD